MRPVLLALICVAAGCADNAGLGEPSKKDLGPFSGSIAGEAFILDGGHARTLGSSGGIAIDLADYPIGCGDYMSQAAEGSRYVSMILEDGYDIPGLHQVVDDPLGGGVGAVITTWKVDAEDGSLYVENLILTEGGIQLDDVSETAVVGSAELSSPLNADFVGTFSVARCEDL